MIFDLGQIKRIGTRTGWVAMPLCDVSWMRNLISNSHTPHIDKAKKIKATRPEHPK